MNSRDGTVLISEINRFLTKQFYIKGVLIRFLVVPLILFSGSFSLAALQPNHLVTPTAEQHLLTFGVSYDNNTNELEQPNWDSFYQETQTLGLDFKYAYGLSDDQALSVSLGIASVSYAFENYVNATATTTDGDDSFSGLRGLTLKYEGKKQIEPVELYYSAAYQTAIEEPAADNTAYKQAALLLEGGVFHQLESTAIVGGTLRYALMQDAEFTDATDTDQRLSGGNSLTTTLFYEFAHSIRPQVALIHQAGYASATKPEGGAEVKTPGQTFYGPRISMRFLTVGGTQIIPSLTYLILENKEVGDAEYKKFDNQHLSVDFHFPL